MRINCPPTPIIKEPLIIYITMPRREVRKTTIRYEEQQPKQPEHERSREKRAVVEVVDAAEARRARMALLKRRRDEEELVGGEVEPTFRFGGREQIGVKIENRDQAKGQGVERKQQGQPEVKPQSKALPQPTPQISTANQEQSQSDEQQQRVLLKPVFISKQDRQQHEAPHPERQQQRRKKALKYATKLLMKQLADKKQQGSDEQAVNSSDEELQTQLPDDQDDNNQEYEYELWKIRELKRIRRDKEERRKMEREQKQLERRRKMNNEQILLENKVMGSDATDQQTQTKYVYLQKYYHKGAFYQDSQDAIFKRDYNLPTPLQMQDKSMLPQILQRRQGNFGKKGQSKYKHLTAEDTTNFDPAYRPDESILAGWKKKMAGYKGSTGANI